MNPSLDLADIYEDYTDDGQGLSKPIRTRVDNNEIFLVLTEMLTIILIQWMLLMKYSMIRIFVCGLL